MINRNVYFTRSAIGKPVVKYPTWFYALMAQMSTERIECEVCGISDLKMNMKFGWIGELGANYLCQYCWDNLNG